MGGHLSPLHQGGQFLNELSGGRQTAIVGRRLRQFPLEGGGIETREHLAVTKHQYAHRLGHIQHLTSTKNIHFGAINYIAARLDVGQMLADREDYYPDGATDGEEDK